MRARALGVNAGAETPFRAWYSLGLSWRTPRDTASTRLRMSRRSLFTSVLALGLLVTGMSLYVTAQHHILPNVPPVGAAVPRAPANGVFSYHNDPGRMGQNLTETLLTPATVTPDGFGLLKTDYRVDGAVLAQPLYAPDVRINGASYNIVIVVTAHDTVYAFDADMERHPEHWASPLWTRSLLNRGATAVPGSCNDIDQEIGITGTPVIDPNTSTLYVVAKSQEADASQAFTLYALDVATGLDDLAVGGPVRITAADAVTGAPLDAVHENQRAGLALFDGIVYVAFGANCDQTPYHGWLLGYDTTNRLTPVVVFNTSPGSNFGGIWASGAAPAIDLATKTMFVSVANGAFQPAHGQWGDSILKMRVDRRTAIASPSGALLDYFSPFNRNRLNSRDLDLGSGGVMLLPDQAGRHTHLLIEGSKQGLIYVLDRDQMTVGDQHVTSCSDADLAALASANMDGARSTYSETCDPIVQAVTNVTRGKSAPKSVRTYRGPGMYGTPAYWKGSVYIGAAGDNLKQFGVEDGMLVNAPRSMSPGRFSWPGVTPSISANGASSGIVWVVDSGDHTVVGASADVPAVLYAFDATDLSHVLYKSSGTAADQRNGIIAPNRRDAITHGHRFALPTIFDGKVFVATRTHLHVFGLL